MRLKNHLHFFFTKLTHFEYWPFWLFYFPLYFYGLYLAFRARSFMYFSATNPSMKYGGVVGESKFKVLASIPKEYLPKTVFITRSTSFSSIINMIALAQIDYPFVMKPDVGERGKDVEIIHTKEELQSYLKNKSFDLIAQEYITHPMELGIMYHRMPGALQGEVTSVVQKGFLSVTGDGRRNLKELISNEIRAKNRLGYLQEKFKKELDFVLRDGESKYLEPIGNHCRGTTFHNANHLINDSLQKVLNNISLNIEGFYYGRFDLKVPSADDLYRGKNVKILELNGVSSEIAHVYDPNYKLFRAYKDIAVHMLYIYQIAVKNHAAGIQYAPLRSFLRDLKNHISK